ncbi:MAG: serine/threonine-protein kinase, partial [Myxococcota bacterium]
MNGGAAQPLRPGMMLTPTLRLVRELGRGAMGTVWVAENTSLSSRVAVKFLQDRDDRNDAARFVEEARGVSAIQSPHVVTVFDLGVSQQGDPYIVMELLSGEDLKRRLSRGGAMGLHEAADVVVQICRGLSRAHQVGIVHRDLKPANVFLVENDGRPLVKILDFGVAKRMDGPSGLTLSGAMVGTPYYMSPEQIVDPRTVDHRADLWSTGAIAYACLTGRLPFLGETLGALSIAIHQGEYPVPSSLVPSLPPSIDRWMAKALGKRITDRFQSAREMGEALDHAIAAVPAAPGPRTMPNGTQLMAAVPSTLDASSRASAAPTAPPSA